MQARNPFTADLLPCQMACGNRKLIILKGKLDFRTSALLSNALVDVPVMQKSF